MVEHVYREFSPSNIRLTVCVRRRAATHSDAMQAEEETKTVNTSRVLTSMRGVALRCISCVQTACGSFADKYVEYELILVVLDLLLLKVQVYRHCLYNLHTQPFMVSWPHFDDGGGRRQEQDPIIWSTSHKYACGSNLARVSRVCACWLVCSCARLSLCSAPC